MPETAIGFFPDVGALHLLSRAPGELGTHLALTGTTVGGADAVVLGLAHAVWTVPTCPRSAPRWPRGDRTSSMGCAGTATRSGPGQRWIDECYAGDDPALVLKALHANASPAAGEAAGCCPGGHRCPWRSRSRPSAE